jgi:hypothetical protein
VGAVRRTVTVRNHRCGASGWSTSQAFVQLIFEIALPMARKHHAVSGCIFAETGILGCTATALLEATMLTTARFPGSTRDI